VELFLSLAPGTVVRRLGIVCSLVLVQGQIFSLKADVQENQPIRRGKLGKHQYRRHRLGIRPSQLLWLFRGCRVFVEVQLDPKRYVHCVVYLFVV
jgi:hypothetical protein